MGWGDVANGKAGGGAPRKGGWGGVGNTAIAPEHHQGGGGLFGAIGSVGHWVGQKAELAGHDIAQIPGGTLHIVKSALPTKAEIEHPLRFNTKSAKRQWGGFLTHPVREQQHAARGDYGKEAQTSAAAVGGLIGGAKTALRHPGRDPFQTVLTALPLVDVAGRVGEAGIAAREGGVGAAGRALVRHGEPPIRTLKMGDKEATLLASKNAGVRLAQRGYDRALQRQLNREDAGQPVGRIGARVAKHGVKRIRGAMGEEHRLSQRMLNVPAEQLDNAASRLAKTPRARRAQQAALEATSTQGMPGELAHYHLGKANEARKAGDIPLARRHAQVAKIYQRAEKMDLVHLDESRPAGDQVFINPAHKRLATVDARLRRAGDLGDETLAEKGVMSPEQLQQARNNPGRIRAGATYENPTPGKAGVPSATLEFRRAETRRLQAASDRANERVQRMRFTAADQRRIGNGATPPIDATTLRERLGPLDKQLRALTDEWNAPAKQGGQMTEAEAHARLAELDKLHQAMLEKIVPEVSPYGGRITKSETARRNVLRSKAGRGKYRNVKASEVPTVKQEELQLAEDKLHELIAKHPEHPTVRQMGEVVRERQHLNDILTQRAGADIMGEQPAALPATGGISPYEERAQLHRILRKGTTAEKRVQEFAQAAGTSPTVHGLNDLKEQAATLTDRINELRGTPGPAIKELRREIAGIRKAIRDAEAPRSRVVNGSRPHVVAANGDIIRPIGANHADRIGAALSVAKDKLQQAEAAAARREKPTGIIGGEAARHGRTHVSYRASEKGAPQSPVAGARSQVTGKAAEPIPANQRFTGFNIEQARIPKHITGAASRKFRLISRFKSTDALRRDIIKTGSKTSRGTGREVLLAEPDAAQAAIDTGTRQLLGQERSTLDTPEELAHHADDAATEEGLRAGLQERLQGWLSKSDQRPLAAGQEAPDGFRWVDENLVKSLHEEARPRGGVGAGTGRVVDNANHAVTALTVYFKVGHTGTRVLTNAATNIMQGSALPHEVRKSYELWSKMSDEQRGRFLAASGQHGFAALPTEGGTEGRVGRSVTYAARGGAKFWARRADAPFRFNGLAYQLREAGYKTPAEVNRALDALESGGEGMPAHEWSKISAAARRSDRELIAYDRLNPFEQRFLTRGIWFYPWVKGATLFTVRSMLEHPYKFSLLGNAGAAGRKQQEKALGNVPSYEQGLLAIGGGKNPLTTDLSTFTPFSTAGDVVQAAAHPGSLSGFLNPAAGAVGQFAYGLNQYGAPSSTPYKDALLALAAATPEQQLALAYAARHQDQSQRMFHKTPGSTALRFLIGPGYPRRVNRAALAKAAKRERSGQR